MTDKDLIIKTWNYILAKEKLNKEEVLLQIQSGNLDEALKLMEINKKIIKIKHWIRQMIP